MLRPCLLRSFVLLAAVTAGGATADAQPATETPTFRAGVDLVPLTAVVRDGRGRTLRGLQPQDFVVLERGRPRNIASFRAGDQGPVSLAILMDTSGSMRVGRQLDAARATVEHVLSWVDPSTDEIGLFSFDRDPSPRGPVHEERGQHPGRRGPPGRHGHDLSLRRHRVDREGARRSTVAPAGGDRGHGRRRHQQHDDGGPGVWPGQRHRRAGVRDCAAVSARSPGYRVRGSQLDRLRGRHAPGQPVRLDRRRPDDGERASARQRRRPRSADAAAPPVRAGIRVVSERRAGTISRSAFDRRTPSSGRGAAISRAAPGQPSQSVAAPSARRHRPLRAASLAGSHSRPRSRSPGR